MENTRSAELRDCRYWSSAGLYSTRKEVYCPEKEYFITVFDVITERKQAEEELRKHRDHLEEMVKDRTAELEKKIAEIERLNRLFVRRELRIKELKKKIKELGGQAAREKSQGKE